MKIWWPLSKSWSHWQPHRLQRQALLKEDHEVIPMLRSLLTDTLCNLPGQERLQPHQWGLRPLLFSSGVGSFASQKNQISQSAARQTYAFLSLSEKSRRSIKSLQMSLQRQHFLPSYLKIPSVGPARVWTHDLLLSRPALSQLSKQDGNTSAAQAIVSYCIFSISTQKRQFLTRLKQLINKRWRDPRDFNDSKHYNKRKRVCQS